MNHQTETTVPQTPLNPIERFLTPLQRFAAQEASGGVVLIFATFVALAWANWGPEGSYHHFFENRFGISLGDWSISKSLHHWINDGLMAIFFFVVGLEIKRELIIGELSAFRKAALPVAGALGGMVVPAATVLGAERGYREPGRLGHSDGHGYRLRHWRIDPARTEGAGLPESFSGRAGHCR